MSEYLWIVVVVVLPLLVVFAFFGYLRLKGPYSKKKAEEQEKLDKKHGASSGTPSATATDKRVVDEKGIKWPFIVAGVIAVLLLGVWWWGTSSSAPPATPGAEGAPGKLSLSPKGVADFLKDYWFWAIIGFAILFFGFGSTTKPWAKAAQGIVGVVALTLVGALAVHGIWGESPSSPKISRSEIPLASSPQSEWLKLVIPPVGKSRLVPRPSGMHILMAGKQFTHYAVYDDGRECAVTQGCPEGSVGSIAKNDSREEIIVSYSYRPD